MRKLIITVLLIFVSNVQAMDFSDLKDLRLIAEGGTCRFNNNDGNWGNDDTAWVQQYHYYNVSSEHSPCWSAGLALQRPWYRWELRLSNYGGPRSTADFPWDQDSPAAMNTCPNTYPYGCPTQHFTSWGQAKSAGIEWAPELSFWDHLVSIGLGVGVHAWVAGFNYCIVQETPGVATTGYQNCQHWKDHGLTLALRPSITLAPSRNTSLVLSVGYFPNIEVRGGDNNDKGSWNNITTANAALVARF